MTRELRPAVLLLASALAASGCGAGTVPGPYAERFEQELAGELSDHQREVFRDHAR